MARPIEVQPPVESQSKTPIRFLPIPKPRGGKYRLIDAEWEIGDVGDFYMAETLITVGQWGEFESATINVFGNNPNLPRENISSTEAEAYCEAIQVDGYKCRLPTEYEWEWAALGGEEFTHKDEDGKIQVIGSCTNLDKIAWYESNSDFKTHEVKRKKPNGYGLYDMIGNVREWTSTSDGPSRVYPLRVYRGGSWGSLPSRARVAIRIPNAPGRRDNDLGVRPVLVVKS